MASSWRPTFTARPDFMGFEQTGNYMPPRRRPSSDARFPEWFQAVPRKYKYPWNELKLPAVSSERVSRVFINIVCIEANVLVYIPIKFCLHLPGT